MNKEIKCLKCGAMYPRLIDTDTVINYDEGLIVQKFECACTNEFEITFVRND